MTPSPITHFTIQDINYIAGQKRPVYLPLYRRLKDILIRVELTFNMYRKMHEGFIFGGTVVVLKKIVMKQAVKTILFII